MSLKSRLPKINQVATSETTRLVFDNKSKTRRQRTYSVKSIRTDKPYQVKTEWSKNGVLTLETELVTYDHKEQVKINGRWIHPANNGHTVAYQCLGVAKRMAKEAGKTLSLCKDYKSAIKLLNFGGELVKITNLNGGIVWCTVR